MDAVDIVDLTDSSDEYEHEDDDDIIIDIPANPSSSDEYVDPSTLIGSHNFLEDWMASVTPNLLIGFEFPPRPDILLDAIGFAEDGDDAMMADDTDDSFDDPEGELDMEGLEKLAKIQDGYDEVIDKFQEPEFLTLMKTPKLEIFHDPEYAPINNLLNDLSPDYELQNITNILPEDYIQACGGKEKVFVDVTYYINERRHEHNYDEMMKILYCFLRKAGATEEEISNIDKTVEELSAKDKRIEVKLPPISPKIKREYWDQAVHDLEQRRDQEPDTDEEGEGSYDEYEDDDIEDFEAEEDLPNENPEVADVADIELDTYLKELSNEIAVPDVIDAADIEMEEVVVVEVSEDSDDIEEEEEDNGNREENIETYLVELSKDKTPPEIIDLSDDDDSDVPIIDADNCIVLD